MTITPEFVRLTPAEQVYGKKQFLYSQLGILALMQRYNSYEALRKEELGLKISLKTIVAEARNALKDLDAVMPKIAVQEKSQTSHASTREEVRAIKAEEKELEHEIADIRRRLEQLG